MPTYYNIMRSIISCIITLALLIFHVKVINGFVNQFTSGILYFFRSPRMGLFSVKIQKKFLAINNFSGQ